MTEKLNRGEEAWQHRIPRHLVKDNTKLYNALHDIYGSRRGALNFFYNEAAKEQEITVTAYLEHPSDLLTELQNKGAVERA
ncbi:hypothetical protein FSARC_1716 [Fusarium sarcochroum]|uniref:Uncharacterized protein n=1 Tax=Fusarium sarcochroum TaxID=1208366 RepID=A0A8H4U830_9HYPO|nr:hypothetical protein FSARC_1716 [Fusarium sarcochroum]